MSIKIEQLSVSYGTGKEKITALKNINCMISKGEIVGILGRSGSGKTSFIQTIAGLLEPDEGRIFIDEEDISRGSYDRSSLRKKVGIVFQYPEYQLFESTVEKDVAFGLKHSGLSGEEISKRVKKSLELLGFSYEDICKKSPLALSGGEKRRVAIAGVLVNDPEILIFDEPIAGLDSFGKKAFFDLLTACHQQGKTILLISHDADVLAEYTQRLLVFEFGELIREGSTREIFSDISWMEEHALDVSAARRIARSFKEQGVLLSEETITYEELCSEIVNYFSKGEGI